jgi:hypothetical protein
MRHILAQTAVGALSFLLLHACHGQLETRTKHVVHQGELAVLSQPGRSTALLSLTKEDSHALARALASGVANAVEALIRDGKLMETKQETSVKVVAESFNERRVEILSGPLAGREGWVPQEWLKPDVGPRP